MREGTRERQVGYLSPSGETKDSFRIERRQTWHKGKWRFKKVQRETPCQDEVVLTGHVN